MSVDQPLLFSSLLKSAYVILNGICWPNTILNLWFGSWSSHGPSSGTCIGIETGTWPTKIMNTAIDPNTVIKTPTRIIVVNVPVFILVSPSIFVVQVRAHCSWYTVVDSQIAFRKFGRRKSISLLNSQVELTFTSTATNLLPSLPSLQKRFKEGLFDLRSCQANTQQQVVKVPSIAKPHQFAQSWILLGSRRSTMQNCRCLGKFGFFGSGRKPRNHTLSEHGYAHQGARSNPARHV